MKGNDVVIGSRYVKGGSSRNGFNKVMSLALNWTYGVVLKLKVRDMSTSFRIYKAEQLKALTLSCDNFDILEEILVLLIAKNPALKIAEIPVAFHERQHGDSKRSLARFIFSYIGTMLRLRKIKRQAAKL
jgi:dolichol-phosphate mannosyltransferase